MGRTSIYRQSGVIPHRRRDGRIEILLVTSRNGRRWVIPKGIIEPHLSPRRSAEKEALEEAGIKGRVSRKSIGSYTYEKWSGTCHVEVFEMKVERVEAKWQEQVRTRRWFAISDAASKVDQKKLKQLIREVGSRASLNGKAK
ncbi:MAG TPA: NUDIX hydrolase [Rhodothermales bacterium]|nr:NUDIX hydrolase [Rhodothermales bacterium]